MLWDASVRDWTLPSPEGATGLHRGCSAKDSHKCSIDRLSCQLELYPVIRDCGVARHVYACDGARTPLYNGAVSYPDAEVLRPLTARLGDRRQRCKAR